MTANNALEKCSSLESLTINDLGIGSISPSPNCSVKTLSLVNCGFSDDSLSRFSGSLVGLENLIIVEGSVLFHMPYTAFKNITLCEKFRPKQKVADIFPNICIKVSCDSGTKYFLLDDKEAKEISETEYNEKKSHLSTSDQKSNYLLYLSQISNQL